MRIMRKLTFLLFAGLLIIAAGLQGQGNDEKFLTLDRIFNSDEFSMEYAGRTVWIENGKAFLKIEPSSTPGATDLVRYDIASRTRSLYLDGSLLKTGSDIIPIESYTLSDDGSRILVFTNSSRVWRSNTKGDYWVFDRTTGTLKKLGNRFPASSLMFAKFSSDPFKVAYVHGFNIYLEDLKDGTITQLTFDGDGKIINGTFDWVYEEEFGKRDGFSFSPDGQKIAFWQIDATQIKNFYLINNTDSIYSKPYPVQYPKTGQTPAGAKIGVISIVGNSISWVRLEGSEFENYIPEMDWVNSDLILIGQLNRKQNDLAFWTYKPSAGQLKKIYTETEDTWVDINYPDVSSTMWGKSSLVFADDKRSLLRMTETDGWRHVYKIDLNTGTKILLTPGNYDVASICAASSGNLFFIASPSNSTQRFLYRTDLKGKGRAERLTPGNIQGVNLYNFAPDGRHALYTNMSHKNAPAVMVVNMPDHRILDTLVSNLTYDKKISGLALPEIRFEKVPLEGGLEMDARIIYPLNFDPSGKYPVLFHTYGEPWGAEVLDTPVDLLYLYLAQKGYFVIGMDNRGTPCLKGSAWRKSIYRKMGIINSGDQAAGAEAVLKASYFDRDKIAVWGWSGGGSMTMNLMFRYPDIYKTGIAVAGVSNLLTYDNIYQERYCGLPSENMDEYIQGSPITHAKNLKGNLLLIHGTGDDNVHYQNCEMVVNELIKHNKQFRMMAYPNRTHSISEGENTTIHLFTLITDFLLRHAPTD
jgi:dipeptidyl-peptidase 4